MPGGQDWPNHLDVTSVSACFSTFARCLVTSINATCETNSLACQFSTWSECDASIHQALKFHPAGSVTPSNWQCHSSQLVVSITRSLTAVWLAGASPLQIELEKVWTNVFQHKREASRGASESQDNNIYGKWLQTSDEQNQVTSKCLLPALTQLSVICM